MKTILHFANQCQVQMLSSDILSMAHLVTFTVPFMNGEYEDRAIVYKNRAGNQNVCISLEQLRILQDCVWNDKPQPEFMKSNGQKAQDAIKRIEKERDTTISFYKSRLTKLEADLFPAGYVDCTGGSSPWNLVPIEERFSRIEKILGVIKSPGDISLARLENCEYHFNVFLTRLKNLTNAIFATRDAIYGMNGTTTYEGEVRQLEEKLGITGCVTRYGDYNSRLEKIERIADVWNPTYVRPVLKHQQALQDALQDAFGKKETFKHKFKVGDTIIHSCNGVKYIIDNTNIFFS